ncbi:MAG: GntR family transcriptional regulator [Treponema sp.]|jgi:GntR family transcriptional regulator|nr:GntR family transcriptional regulator [Treponema sp.]
MNRSISENTFVLDKTNGVPIYRQLIQQIKYIILSGQAQPGDRLPTIRSLSVALKINPNTIAKAYNELEICGILATQVGSGTYIADKKPQADDSERLEKVHDTIKLFMQELRNLGVKKEEVCALIANYEEVV